MSLEITLYTLYEKVKSNISLHEKNAIVFFDGQSSWSVTYAQLDNYVNRMASELLSISASNEIIACFCGPGLHLPVLLLGILKISSAFMVLDNDNPNAFLENAMKYIPVRTIITERKTYESAKLHLCPCWTTLKITDIGSVSLIMFQSVKASCTKHKGNEKSQKEEKQKFHQGLAYVVQTSGTTDLPKVVQVTHDCIVPNILHLSMLYSISPNDKVFLSSPLTFDPSIIDIFLSLSSGACLIMVSDHIKLMPKKLSEVFLKYEVTVIQVTPSFLQTLDATFLYNKLFGKYSKLRILALGGELCPTIERLQSLKENGNKTRFFNLYGLTEVSCWAMYNEIAFDVDSKTSDVPLGLPLLDTCIDVQDEFGQSIDEGYGQLFIGGPKRWCVINGESWETGGKMRPSGDWVFKNKNGEILFQGRKDGILKYNGKKFNICELDYILEKLPEVMKHSVVFQKEELKLYIFIVLHPMCHRTKEEVKSCIVKVIRTTKPNSPVFQVVFIPYIPITSHGKSDSKKLLNYVSEVNALDVGSSKCFSTSGSFEEAVASLWKDLTGAKNINDTDNFVLSGGNSVSAVQFVMEIESKFAVLCPRLIDMLLNSTYKSVIELLKQQSLKNNASPPLKKTKTVYADDKVTTSDLFSKVIDCGSGMCHHEASKRGYKTSCFCRNCLSQMQFFSQQGEILVLQEYFQYDLKKCVDASPCLISYANPCDIICFIGSHSGIFAAINMEQKTTFWEVQLPGRIESSACVSACGQFVFVGSYDQHLYCFHYQTGNLKWKVKAEAEIKSSPISSGNHVFIGSHDRNLYAVNIQDGTVVWKRQISQGSIFSSPAVLSERLCAATLDGVIATFNTNDGSTIWTYKYNKPFFSSPLYVKTSVFIGCVDGCLLNIDCHGYLVGKYALGGPLFSSPALLSVQNEENQLVERIVIGSHDAKVYCYSLTGECIWTFQCRSSVYSTPFSFSSGSKSGYIAVACTEGTVFILNAQDGNMICSFTCPGEIFSSPVVLNNYLVVGCRDNNVYFFKI